MITENTVFHRCFFLQRNLPTASSEGDDSPSEVLISFQRNDGCVPLCGGLIAEKDRGGGGHGRKTVRAVVFLQRISVGGKIVVNDARNGVKGKVYRGKPVDDPTYNKLADDVVLSSLNYRIKKSRSKQRKKKYEPLIKALNEVSIFNSKVKKKINRGKKALARLFKKKK